MEATKLLQREPHPAPTNDQLSCLEGATVLVTGAGGSIGSKLCALLATTRIKRLLLAELSELALYQIERQLSQTGIEVVPLLADIRHEHIVRQLFWEHRPEIVLHAAALKHVPMLQTPHNAIEAVRTNVLGTALVMREAGRCPSTKISMLVSTDKAVNPTSWMGVTKRCAEKLVFSQAISCPHVQHMIVRFGNVLGSSGSVVPLFREQIANGGPVTITDPQMTRFMMTIDEAVALMLSAVDLGSRLPSNFGLFVLDMGKPILIADLAKRVMAEAGTKVKTKVIGLRPGEKLYEELFYAHEKPVQSERPGVLQASAFLTTMLFEKHLAELIDVVGMRDIDRTVEVMATIVPEVSMQGIL